MRAWCFQTKSICCGHARGSIPPRKMEVGINSSQLIYFPSPRQKIQSVQNINFHNNQQKWKPFLISCHHKNMYASHRSRCPRTKMCEVTRLSLYRCVASSTGQQANFTKPCNKTPFSQTPASVWDQLEGGQFPLKSECWNIGRFGPEQPWLCKPCRVWGEGCVYLADHLFQHLDGISKSKSGSWPSCVEPTLWERVCVEPGSSLQSGGAAQQCWEESRH